VHVLFARELLQEVLEELGLLPRHDEEVSNHALL
jgi:hypothetical protein